MDILLSSIKYIAQDKVGIDTIKGQLPDNPLEKYTDIPSLLNGIFELAYFFVGLISVVFLIIGGYQYLTAAGNDEKTKSATKTITGAIIGIILVLAAVAIQYTIVKLLGAN